MTRINKAANANAAWLASNLNYSADAGLLTNEQKRYFEMLHGGKKMDINPTYT